MTRWTEAFLERQKGFVPNLLKASSRGAHRIEDAVEFAFALDDVCSDAPLPGLLGKRAERPYDGQGSIGTLVLRARDPVAVLEILDKAVLAVRKDGAMRSDKSNVEALQVYGFVDVPGEGRKRETGARLAARVLTCLAADHTWVPYARGVLDARNAAPSSLRSDIWAASATIHAWALTDRPAIGRALGAVLSGPHGQVRSFPSFVDLFRRVARPWLLGPPGFERESVVEALDRCCNAAALRVSHCLADPVGPAGIRAARVADEVLKTFGEFFERDLRANRLPPDRSATPRAGLQGSLLARIERQAMSVDRVRVGSRPPSRGSREVLSVKVRDPLAPESEEDIAYARAYLTRVRILRKERETVRAQELFNNVPLPAWLDQEEPSPDVREGFLVEQYRLERARLKLRVHDRAGVREPDAHDDACAELQAMHGRLVPVWSTRANAKRGASEAKSPSDRHLRLVAELADALTVIGDHEGSVSVAAYLFRLDPDRLVLREQFERIFEKDSRQKIVDLVQRQARRLSGEAYLLALAGDSGRALTLLSHAKAAAEAAAERAVRDYPALAVRATLARIEVERAALVLDFDERRERLAIVAAQALQVYLDSRQRSEIPPDRLAIREGHYGAALAEIVRNANPAEVREIAVEATVRLYPQIQRYEVDGNDDPARSIRYGDACAACGDDRQAAVAWRRILGRFHRIGAASQPLAGAAQALERRLRDAEDRLALSGRGQPFEDYA